METKQIILKSGKEVIVTTYDEPGGIVRVETDADVTREEMDEILGFI